MGATRDFVSATVADALLPAFRRPVEDIIYETLDRRQVPTRTDFKEMRDLLNNLRGQVSGASNGIRKVVERSEETEDLIDQLEAKLTSIESRFSAITDITSAAEKFEARISKMENEHVTLARFSAAISGIQASFPQTITPAELAEAIANLKASIPAPQPAVTPAQLAEAVAALKADIPAPTPAVTPSQLAEAVAALRADIPAPTPAVTPAQLDAAISALKAGISTSQPAVTPAQLAAAVAALRAEISAPQPAEAEAAVAEPAPAVAPPTESICRVPGCGQSARARGFCARHYQRWRRGTLKGDFVSLDGNIRIGEQTVKVDSAHAGAVFRVEDGDIYIGDVRVSTVEA